jgi:hypothetical protein
VSFFGLGAAYPAFKARLAEVSTPQFNGVLDFVTSHCALDVVQKYSGTDFFVNGTYFIGGEALLRDGIIRASLPARISMLLVYADQLSLFSTASI